MSNVPLGSGGTSPHAAKFTAEVNFQRLIHSLAIRAEMAASMYLCFCKAPLSHRMLDSYVLSQSELSKCDDVCTMLYGLLVEHFKPATEGQASETPAAPATLFPPAPSTGPYSEGR